jgi:hypothetical protein
MSLPAVAPGPPPTGSDHQSRRHFRLPAERPFVASERSSTSILIGGLTQRHDRFVQAVFEGSGYRCVSLPVPDRLKPAVAPIGLDYLASALRGAGFDPHLFDMSFMSSYKEPLRFQIQRLQPLAIGISVRNIDQYNTLMRSTGRQLSLLESNDDASTRAAYFTPFRRDSSSP